MNLCMFCGHSHGNLVPMDCRIKGAIAMALLETQERATAMWILDKTSFLEQAAKEIQQIIEQDKK